MGYKIGIGITTHNRRDIFNKTYLQIRRFAPRNSKIVVVDDGSNIPLKIANIRNEKPKGIAASKNACLRLLDQCDHIFLFDDDVYPKRRNWFVPYINSGMNHLCLSFEHNSKGTRLSHDVFVSEKKQKYWIYNSPNGCMLYLTNEVLKRCGGMDTSFGIWGNEHIEYSKRIHNFKLTPYPYMDVPYGIRYFHCHDYYGKIESSIDEKTRRESMRENIPRLKKSLSNNKFIPYK